MSVIFEGIEMPKACCFVDGEHSSFAHFEYCKFYNICKQRETFETDFRPNDCPVKPINQEMITKNDLGVDAISRADALRVAKNEYLRGWHNALCKALSEKYSIHCEEGNFNVIQEETITGLGLSMNCAVGKDVENYMSTIPRVTPIILKGHWIWETDETPSTPISPYELNYAGWVCSCCHEFPDDICEWDNPDEPPTYKFCPNCGAKMESEDKE